MSDSFLRRRSFLGLVGGVASLGTLVVGSPGLLAAPAPRAQNSLSTVGVILPSSRKNAERLGSYRTGIALAAERSGSNGGQQLQVVYEEIDCGGGGIAVALDRLQARHRAGIIIGCLDARLAQQAAAACAGRSLYLDCSAGACVALNERSERGYLECSLAHWQNAYAAGRWSAGAGTRAGMVTSFFEAGYDALYAFRLGFEDGGGAILDTVVVDVPGREMAPREAVDQLLACRPDIIYAALHDHQGRLFLQALKQSPGANQALVLGNEFMAEDLDAGCLPDDGLFTCSSYDPALAVDANRAFSADFRAATGRSPDAFAVLGHDAATLAAALAEQLGSAAWRPGWSGAVAVASPRGALELDLGLGLASVPHYLCRLSPTPGGVAREVLQQLGTIDERDPRIIALQRALRSGWINPYLME